MPSDYRLVLMDEFDWEYGNFDKTTITTKIEERTSFRIVAQLPYLIVLNLEHVPGENAIIELHEFGCVFDSAYEIKDNETLIRKLYP